MKNITTEKEVDKKEILDKWSNMIFKSYAHELNTPLH